MVKSRKERMTKRGQKFGLFEVEDFSGSHSMALFKEEFFNFWNMLEEGNAVLITGAYRDRNERREGYEEHWELSPSKVELLSEARERYVREVMLDIRISDIEAGRTEELVARLEENRGNVPLKIRIIDTEKRFSLQTSCSKYLIDVNKGILEYFENAPEYRLIIKS
jgi:DNA polymerase-3 subunit alpha